MISYGSAQGKPVLHLLMYHKGSVFIPMTNPDKTMDYTTTCLDFGDTVSFDEIDVFEKKALHWVVYVEGRGKINVEAPK